jgi:hypothetical protein
MAEAVQKFSGQLAHSCSLFLSTNILYDDL